MRPLYLALATVALVVATTLAFPALASDAVHIHELVKLGKGKGFGLALGRSIMVSRLPQPPWIVKIRVLRIDPRGDRIPRLTIFVCRGVGKRVECFCGTIVPHTGWNSVEINASRPCIAVEAIGNYVDLAIENMGLGNDTAYGIVVSDIVVEHAFTAKQLAAQVSTHLEQLAARVANAVTGVNTSAIILSALVFGLTFALVFTLVTRAKGGRR